MSNETPVPPGPVQPVVMPDDYWCDDDDDYGYECELCGAAGPLNDMDCDACGAQGCDRCIHHSMDDCIGYLCEACMKALDRGGKSAANVMAMRFGGSPYRPICREHGKLADRAGLLATPRRAMRHRLFALITGNHRRSRR